MSKSPFAARAKAARLSETAENGERTRRGIAGTSLATGPSDLAALLGDIEAEIFDALPLRLRPALARLLEQARRPRISRSQARAARKRELVRLLVAESRSPRFAGLSERKMVDRLAYELKRAICRPTPRGDTLDRILQLSGGVAIEGETIRQHLLSERMVAKQRLIPTKRQAPMQRRSGEPDET